MISDSITSSFQNCLNLQGLQGYGSSMAGEDAAFEPRHTAPGIGEPSHSGALLYSLSVLKEKVQQVQTLAGIVLTTSTNYHDRRDQSLAIAGMGTLIQEIIVTASSMMFTCQQLALGAASCSSAAAANNANNNNNNVHSNQFHEQHIIEVPSNKHVDVVEEGGDIRGLFAGDQRSLHCFSNYKDNSDIGCINIIDHQSNSNRSRRNINSTGDEDQVAEEMSNIIEVPNAIGNDEELLGYSPWNGDNNCDIIELNANDLLAKYTHYCQVCGKGFKRDANLRMHMRAHGDEYKSKAALSNPMKKMNEVSSISSAGNSELEDKNLKRLPMRKYSCPQEGCRWNRKHAKFQPLKSMICVKNHYKRSHCPKMYVCNRCNQKQFSVLSDLRTHEKHCGELKWQCSCGTTFSRKDKLMGHVNLFFGHAPVGNLHMNSK